MLYFDFNFNLIYDQFCILYINKIQSLFIINIFFLFPFTYFFIITTYDTIQKTYTVDTYNTVK